MYKIGITGQTGFVGTHLFNTLGLFPDKYERISFTRSLFQHESGLDDFVSKCDVIVHLAALNRHTSQEVLYKTNVELIDKLVASLNRTQSRPHVIFSSSSQEERENLYGQSKKDGRERLALWAEESGGKFTGLIIPNVFGPFGMPNYNSFIATFCHRLTHGEEPEMVSDGTVKLIYVGDLIKEILLKVCSYRYEPIYYVPHTIEIKVSEVLTKLKEFKMEYFEKGRIPILDTRFDVDLFNTFRSYIDCGKYFPAKFEQHSDERGAFVEIARLGIGGQVSFSTTFPGITRGNHYHTRKIERFAVIKGIARIALRRIGTSEVLNFYLDGREPSYVDMPIWYTHNIENIGNDVVYTNFWINEAYNPDDPDTYFEKV